MKAPLIPGIPVCSATSILPTLTCLHCYLQVDRAHSQGLGCLEKAALKTPAVQTLARPRIPGGISRSVWSASDLSALSGRDGSGRGSRSRSATEGIASLP